MIKKIKNVTSFIITLFLVQSTLYAPNQGLVNQNVNDCFFSSSFQCLSQIKPLIEFLSNNPDIRTPIGQDIKDAGTIQSRFYKFVQDMKTDSELTAEFRQFITEEATDDFFLHQMATGQRDAHEFLSLLLQYLISKTPYHAIIAEQLQAIIATKISDAALQTRMIDRIMEILNTDMQKINSLQKHLRYVIQTQPSNAILLSTIPLEGNDDRWEICNKQITKLKKLYSIFDIGLQSTLNGECGHTSIKSEVARAIQVPIPDDTKEPTLQDCIKAFEAEETLSEDDQWFCEQCRKKVDATKQYSFGSLPKVLIISLKRFRAGGALGEKIDTPVSFPLKLPVKINAETLHFNLFGIVCHGGGAGGGHYWAYVKDRMGDNAWRQYNDSYVSPAPLSEPEILKLGEDKEPYIFFYELDMGDEKIHHDMAAGENKTAASTSTTPIIPNTDKINLKSLEDLKAFFKKFASMKKAIEHCNQLLKNIEAFEQHALGIFQYEKTQYSSIKSMFIAALKKKDFSSDTTISFENKVIIDKEQEKLAVVYNNCIQELLKVAQSNPKVSIGLEDANNALIAYGLASDVIDRYNKLLIKLAKCDFDANLANFVGLKKTLFEEINTLSLEDAKADIQTTLAFANQLTPIKNDIEKLLAALEGKLREFDIKNIETLLINVKATTPSTLSLQNALGKLRDTLKRLGSTLLRMK